MIDFQLFMENSEKKRSYQSGAACSSELILKLIHTHEVDTQE